MNKYKKLRIFVAIINLLGVLVFARAVWSYHYSVDASGPGQRAYAQSDQVKHKLERLEITEEALDVVCYWYLTSSAGLMCLSALALLAHRKEPQRGSS
jgi:hypothetical protein